MSLPKNMLSQHNREIKIIEGKATATGFVSIYRSEHIKYRLHAHDSCTATCKLEYLYTFSGSSSASSAGLWGSCAISADNDVLRGLQVIGGKVYPCRRGNAYGINSIVLSGDRDNNKILLLRALINNLVQRSHTSTLRKPTDKW
ncbi:hypothetical protein QTP88_024190 [Uroleucon formosanum]